MRNGDGQGHEDDRLELLFQVEGLGIEALPFLNVQRLGRLPRHGLPLS
jgi:hypothetical protein